jgi:enolase-phosphatase E1
VITTVVLDIEGTTSSLSYVRDRLFPLARRRLPYWLAANRGRPEAEAILAETRRLAGQPGAGPEELTAILTGWASQDAKLPPLKSAQGLIWQEAFAAGELTAHFYPDVRSSLRTWQRRGLRIYVFSSGSVAAQREWFGHCPGGSLLGYLSGHFDTRNAGPKQEASSYRAIAATIGVPPGELLFLSDVPAELDAAADAGWHTTLVRRGEVPPQHGRHPEITSFAELSLRAPAAASPR